MEIKELQARAMADNALLMALIDTHPNQAALKEAFSKLLFVGTGSTNEESAEAARRAVEHFATYRERLDRHLNKPPA